MKFSMMILLVTVINNLVFSMPDKDCDFNGIIFILILRIY